MSASIRFVADAELSCAPVAAFEVLTDQGIVGELAMDRGLSIRFDPVSSGLSALSTWSGSFEFFGMERRFDGQVIDWSPPESVALRTRMDGPLVNTTLVVNEGRTGGTRVELILELASARLRDRVLFAGIHAVHGRVQEKFDAAFEDYVTLVSRKLDQA